MRFVQQKQGKGIVVKNLDISCLDTENKNHESSKHGSLLPNTIRALIVGPSNCGKTNVMISLIESPNGLRFENIYLYSKSLYQPKYEYLKNMVEPIKGMGFYPFSENDEVISPDKAKKNSIMIFDDVACENQNNIRSYFSMGRHKGIDCFYLCQTYTKIPKHLIRDNANVIILFKQDDLNLKHIYNDHVGSGDMTFENFLEMCRECWKDKYDFLMISKDDDIYGKQREVGGVIGGGGRYRKGFNVFIEP